jgi:tetratricopeptide (TPR) repeat protein
MAKNDLRSLIDQAGKKFRAGQYLAAAELYQQAGAQLAHSGDEPMAAEMANNRSVGLLKAGDAQGALDACRGTEQIFARAGDLRRQGMAIGNQAAALEALEQLDEALALYWQSSDLLKQSGDQDTRAYLLQCISALLIRTGRQFEALATMNAALEHKEKLSVQERVLKKVIRLPIQMAKRGG